MIKKKQLKSKTIPFREAHKIIGWMVRYCLKIKKRLQDLNDAEIVFIICCVLSGQEKWILDDRLVFGKWTKKRKK